MDVNNRNNIMIGNKKIKEDLNDISIIKPTVKTKNINFRDLCNTYDQSKSREEET